jgi:hypothetical protein
MPLCNRRVAPLQPHLIARTQKEERQRATCTEKAAGCPVLALLRQSLTLMVLETQTISITKGKQVQRITGQGAAHCVAPLLALPPHMSRPAYTARGYRCASSCHCTKKGLARREWYRIFPAAKHAEGQGGATRQSRQQRWVGRPCPPGAAAPGALCCCAAAVTAPLGGGPWPQLHAPATRKAVRTRQRQAVHTGYALHVGDPPPAQPQHAAQQGGGGDGDAGAWAVEQQEVRLVPQHNCHCRGGGGGKLV